MRLLLYQGLLRSSASWARVGRGYLEACIRCGVDVAVVSSRGFGFDANFALPSGLREVSVSEAQTIVSAVGLGFLHPPHLERLLGRPRVNLFVWESDRVPAAWVPALAGGADCIFVPSGFTARALRESGLAPACVRVVPYGYDADALGLPPPTGGASRPFTFFSVMSPHTRKGVHELLRAYRAAFTAKDAVCLRLKSTYDPASRRRRFPFEIPSWKATLESHGLERGDAPAVELDLGRLSDAEILLRYATVDVCVQPSWGESFGLAILDAAAAARPVIVTGWGGHLEFLPDGPDVLPYGLKTAGDALYEAVPDAQLAVPDWEALAARLRWHYEHPAASRELGAQARQAVAGFTWDAAAQKLLAALEQL